MGGDSDLCETHDLAGPHSLRPMLPVSTGHRAGPWGRGTKNLESPWRARVPVSSSGGWCFLEGTSFEDNIM